METDQNTERSIYLDLSRRHALQLVCTLCHSRCPLYDDVELILSGVFIAYIIIILTNIFSVMVINHYGEGNKKGFLSMIETLL
ncbi:MAG: hypothetical protein ACMUEM_02320 [Flavobacteriales bacterium AspAUS03]